MAEVQDIESPPLAREGDAESAVAPSQKRVLYLWMIFLSFVFAVVEGVVYFYPVLGPVLRWVQTAGVFCAIVLFLLVSRAIRTLSARVAIVERVLSLRD